MNCYFYFNLFFKFRFVSLLVCDKVQMKIGIFPNLLMKSALHTENQCMDLVQKQVQFRNTWSFPIQLFKNRIALRFFCLLFEKWRWSWFCDCMYSYYLWFVRLTHFIIVCVRFSSLCLSVSLFLSSSIPLFSILSLSLSCYYSGDKSIFEYKIRTCCLFAKKDKMICRRW